MRPRLTLALVVASLALLATASGPALGATAGATFLTGGLALPPGAIAGGESGHAFGDPDRVSPSDDGRYVAFSSDADLLDPAANPDTTNVYRKDRLTGAVVLVSRANGANGAAPALPSVDATISDDGSVVAFRTAAGIDPADTNGQFDVYVRDVGAGTTTLASVANGGGQIDDDAFGYDLSGDGAHVAFLTSARVDPVNDTTAFSDVYVRDLRAGRTALISRRAGSVAASNGDSYQPAISDDGGWVAFVSSATDLVAGYSGSGPQVFVRDVGGAVAYLVSNETTRPARAGNGSGSDPDVAGRPGALGTVVVAYTTDATNVALPGLDASSAASVYVHAMSSTSSELISISDSGVNADSRAHTPSISDDGARVEFDTDADNLTTDPDYYGVYLRDRGTGRTLLASASTHYSVQGAIAGGGGFVGWYSDGGETADSDPDLRGVYGRTYSAPPSALGAPELVARPPGTAPFLAPAIQMDSSAAGERTISADGRYIVFLAYNTSRLPGGGARRPGQIYRRDLLTGATELVSRATGANGAPADGSSSQPTISADGSRVAFGTSSQFDPAHPTSTDQAYVRDLAAGTTTLVSRAEGAGGAPADADAWDPRISADGQHVAFVTDAANLGVAGGIGHIWLRDLAGGHTTLVDRATGASGAAGDSDAEGPSPSSDGRWVAFISGARTLDPADTTDNAFDVYVRDTVAGTTTLASRRGGLGGQHATGNATEAAISADGTVVAFTTGDETVAPEAGGWGGNQQVVARTLATGANVLVSRAAGGAPANQNADAATLSRDGGVIAFSSAATNLLAGVGGDGRSGVFARTTATGALSGPPAFGLLDNPLDDYALYPAISDDGQCLAFRAHGHNAITGTAGDFETGYLYVVSGICPKPLPVVPPVVRPIRRAAKPRLTRASLSHKRFRVGRRPTAQTAAVGPAGRTAARRRGRRRPAPVGTTFRFTLSARANVAVVLERQAQGRLVGRFCRRPARRLRRNLRCIRFVRAGKLTRGGMNAGRNSIAFSGRVGRKALRPGKYRARLRATNVGGASAWARVSFVVVRR